MKMKVCSLANLSTRKWGRHRRRGAKCTFLTIQAEKEEKEKRRGRNIASLNINSATFATDSSSREEKGRKGEPKENTFLQ